MIVNPFCTLHKHYDIIRRNATRCILAYWYLRCVCSCVRVYASLVDQWKTAQNYSDICHHIVGQSNSRIRRVMLLFVLCQRLLCSFLFWMLTWNHCNLSLYIMYYILPLNEFPNKQNKINLYSIFICNVVLVSIQFPDQRLIYLVLTLVDGVELVLDRTTTVHLDSTLDKGYVRTMRPGPPSYPYFWGQ